jgi:hypothetical protein
MPLSDQNIKALEKKGYRFVGSHKHSAAKVCHWTKKSIMDDGVCYKEKFYGIKSHRCLQMSPSIPFCHQKCLFCWRDVDVTSTSWAEEYDDPGQIIDECIEAQRKLLVGFFGNPNANQEKVLEAQHPPTPLYPWPVNHCYTRPSTSFWKNMLGEILPLFWSVMVSAPKSWEIWTQNPLNFTCPWMHPTVKFTRKYATPRYLTVGNG